ncbi:MAG TPA: glycosyl hydrolase family 28-related protein, partial [Steroidobacteraceae bacterium]|nr:glycosyl hydrolase family 28-related protein [Steroidobacteraceae bacterium]
MEAAARADVTNAIYPPGDVRRYGGVGNRTADDTTALEHALNAASAGGYVMHLPAGTYRLSKQIRKLESPRCPQIRGDGSRFTRIEYPGLNDQAAMYIQGGSGSACGAIIEGIGFDGSSTSYGIEIDGQDGVTIRDCDFGRNAVGLRLHNESRGAFTEYAVAENCSFSGTCATALQYLVGAGGNSFHGSGLRNCLIQLGRDSNFPIHIGKGASPYNAPMSAQIWTSGSNKTIIRNESSEPVTLHGTITVESLGGTPSQSHSPVLAAGNPVYLVGAVESAGYVNYGSLLTGTRVASLGPESGPAGGQRLIRTHPWTVRRQLTTGASHLANIGRDSCVLLYVLILGHNYDYRHVLCSAMQGYGGPGFVNTLSTLRAFDAARYGAPSFEVDPRGNFIVSNPRYPTSGVTAVLDVVPFGLNTMTYLASAAEYGNV